jgi:hypothetical protein
MCKRAIFIDFCGTIYSEQSTRDVAYFHFLSRPYCKVPKILQIRYISKLLQFLFICFVPYENQMSTINLYLCGGMGSVNFSLLEKYKNDRIIIISAGIYQLISQVCREHLSAYNISSIIAPKLQACGQFNNYQNFIARPWTGVSKARYISSWMKLNQRYQVIFETDSSADDEVSKLPLLYLKVNSLIRFS